MPRRYDNNFKSMIVNLIVNEKHSTIKTAQQFDIPLKTVEKWITASSPYQIHHILVILAINRLFLLNVEVI